MLITLIINVDNHALVGGAALLLYYIVFDDILL